MWLHYEVLLFYFFLSLTSLALSSHIFSKNLLSYFIFFSSDCWHHVVFKFNTVRCSILCLSTNANNIIKEKAAAAKKDCKHTIFFSLWLQSTIYRSVQFNNINLYTQMMSWLECLLSLCPDFCLRVKVHAAASQCQRFELENPMFICYVFGVRREIYTFITFFVVDAALLSLFKQEWRKKKRA